MTPGSGYRTVGDEADGGAHVPVQVRAVQAGVAALVLDGDRLDYEPAVGQRGAQPRPPLVRGLNHGVAPLREGGHVCGLPVLRRASPEDLLHLFGQSVGARQGGLLAANGRLVAVSRDLCWGAKGGEIGICEI